jgi:urocanate hydratase
MRYFLVICLFSMHQYVSFAVSVDTLKYEKRYTKADLKAVKNELSEITQLSKTWKKAAKSKNVDFQNNILIQLKSSLTDQINSFSGNIAKRDRNTSNFNTSFETVDSLTYVEMPVGYNVELNNRPKEISKQDYQSRMQESGILTKYSAIVNAQKQILSKLNGLGSMKVSLNRSIGSSDKFASRFCFEQKESDCSDEN